VDVLLVGVFQRSGPFARALCVQAWEGTSDQHQEKLGLTADGDGSLGPQLLFDLLLYPLTPPGPDPSIGAAQNLVLVSSTKARLAFGIPHCRFK
jgi:hypothetical protein